MDRTTKQILDFYKQSPVNRQRYMFSLAMLGDTHQSSMRELSKRYRKIRKNNPEEITRGFRDMRLDADPHVPAGVRQALHDIKQTSKGIGSTMRIDGMFANHFTLPSVSGAIVPVLGGKAIHEMNDSLDLDKTPEMKMKRSRANDDGNDSSADRSTEEKPRNQKDRESETTTRPENDMNQTNVRRHTEEESEVDNKLARDKKHRRHVQQRMKQRKQLHM